MKAMVLEKQQPLESSPLKLKDVPVPEPQAGEVRIKISVCGVCRTDLHICESELPAHKMPVIPGHQIIGLIDKPGESVRKYKTGDRVGVPWLYKTCGKCKYCLMGKENLCADAMFTGYDADGGFAEYMIAPENFIYPVPQQYSDPQAAPLFCAGVIGYQAFNATGLENSGKLGLFGFGSSAHILIQVAVHKGLEVYVVSRTKSELDLAKKLGAEWTGSNIDSLKTFLDAAIVFAPSGELIVKALDKIDKGGKVVAAGIYATPLPGFDYSAIGPEKCLCSIANTTRESVRVFLKAASEFKIKIEINEYKLTDANKALMKIKHSKVSGSTVLIIG
ncbi:MAG TPA: zinc-dependent alcohol dehydrogenase family protein [bacterium]